MNQIFLKEFCRRFNYPEEATRELCRVYAEIEKDKDMFDCLKSRVELYKISHKKEDLIASRNIIIKQAKLFSQATETVEFLFFVFCSKHLEVLYEEKGYKKKNFEETMLDLKYKLMECYNVKGIWGSFVSEWFIGFFAMWRFALGRLQFEIGTHPPCVSPDGAYCFMGNEKVIDVHIPSAGPLTRENIRSSFEEASLFFKDEFTGDTITFACESWLLFPGHYKMLSPSSGIRTFMDEFTIIKVELDFTDHDLWRIYNTFDTADRDALPTKTSLQRAYVSWLKKGKPIGVGFGIKTMDKPKNKCV